MRKITWAEAKSEINFEVLAGVCSDNPEALRLVNKAQRLLSQRGRWWGTFQRIRLCTTSSCITLPRHVATVEALAWCCESMPIRNSWYEFGMFGDGLQTVDDACRCVGLNGVYDKNPSPTFNDMIGTGKKARLYTTVTEDAAARVLIQGYDDNNQWIRTLDAILGTYIDGIYLTLAAPFVECDIGVITGIQKPVTNGNILLYEYDPVTGLQRKLGEYEPDETTPMYIRKEIVTTCPKACRCAATGTYTADAIVKLEFIPITNDRDYMMISNVPAVEEMIRAVLKWEKNLDDDADKCVARACNFMNIELRQNTPTEQTTINQRIFGAAHLSHKRIGGMI